MAGHWIVAKTQFSREKWAAENVQRQGHEFYLPQYAEVAKRRRNFTNPMAQSTPLFPGYLFVKVEPDKRWQHLLSTFGLSGVLMAGQDAAILPAIAIGKIRSLENQDGLVVLPNPNMAVTPRFQLGQTLRVSEGTFSGFCGVYEGMDARSRVKLLLDYMGRKVPFLIEDQKTLSVV